MAAATKLGPADDASGEYADVADALELAMGKRPTDEQAEAFCHAVALAMHKKMMRMVGEMESY